MVYAMVIAYCGRIFLKFPNRFLPQVMDIERFCKSGLPLTPILVFGAEICGRFAQY